MKAIIKKSNNQQVFVNPVLWCIETYLDFKHVPFMEEGSLSTAW